MNNRNPQNDIFSQLKKHGLNDDVFKNVAAKNDINALLNSLSPKDKEKLQSILNNSEMTRKLLSSEKARELFKKFNGEKNG